MPSDFAAPPNKGSLLLHTKLHQPHVMRHFVARPRLWKLLDQCVDRDLILVAAGPGYGKTTLISSWLEHRTATDGAAGATLPAAWLSLDEYDSDLGVFLRYCIEALRTIFPEACADTLALLNAPQEPPFATLVATLSNELESLPQDFILVLDDYHTIKGEAVPDLLAALAQHWPRFLHLVLITRHNPALPIATLRAKGQIAEIRARDLRFTTDEIRQYISGVLTEPPADRVVEQLERQTEGWIAGLYLFSLALRQDGLAATLMAIKETDGHIAEYLITDVLAQQPPDVVRFLLTTSLLDRWCLPLCEHLVEASAPERDAQACLAWLKRTNFFIIHLDDRQEWFRYHYLLQDLLRRWALVRLGPDQIDELHRQAAAWFEQQGLFEEAMHHTLEARDLDQTARLMQRALREVLNREDRATLDRWLSLLPDDFVERRPWLLMLKCLTLQFAWQLEAISPLLRQIEILIADMPVAWTIADLSILRGAVLTFQGELAYFQNHMEQGVQYVQEALALLPESWTYLRGGCLLFLGMSMQALGQGHTVNALLWTQYETLHEKTNAYATRILFALCVNEIQAGHLEQARQTGELMLEQAQRGGLPVLQGWAHYWLGLIDYSRNDLAQATQHFRAIVEMRFVIQARTARNGLMGLILAQLAQGYNPLARDTLDLLSRFEMETLDLETDETRSLRAQLRLQLGEPLAALRWADAFTTPIPDQPRIWQHDAHITKARLLLARGIVTDVQTAMQIIASLSEMTMRTHNARFTLALTVLRALALDMQGQTSESQVALQQAIEIARPGGFIRIFVDYGAPVQGLLNRLAKHDPADDFIARILAAFPTLQPPAPAHTPTAPAPLFEPLTMRELDVLRLMRERLSDKEIAQQLNIAPVTVKRYAANLYGKLGVNKRWDAVAKAEALGILSSH